MWITKVSVRNPVFATMVMVALCVLGIFSYARLNVESVPDISPPWGMVRIEYPGASPAAVEVEISQPVELVLNGISGVKSLRSNALEGRGETYIEFNLDADMARGIQDVRDKVAALTPLLPKNARAPLVIRFDGENAQPVAQIALVGPQRSDRELSLLADQTVQKALERVEGVARVQVGGLAVRQIRINLDPQRLRAAGVTPADVSAALARANADSPVGLMSNRREDFVLRVDGRVKDPKQFADVVVAKRNGLVVTVGDVGELVEQLREPTSLSRLNRQPTVSFDVFRLQDANIVNVGLGLRKALQNLQQTLPPGVELKLIYNNGDWVKDSLNGVKITLVEGALLTVFIVLLFLHSWRSTVITGLTLPISVISSFIAVNALGFTLNFMTMMALSLCIGLLIDDAIVVRENIVRHVRLGADHHRAALEGTQEIGLAVLATTLAICAVFVPVAFMQGMIGRFFYPFGITVTVAVLVSLFVSFTLDPMLSSVWRDPDDHGLFKVPVLGSLIRFTERVLERLHTLYGRLIGWVFSDRVYRPWLPAFHWGRPRRATLTPRGVVLWIGTLSFFVAVMLMPLVGTEFVPESDQGNIRLGIRLPVGASLPRADEKIRQVEQRLATIPEIDTQLVTIGGDDRGQANIFLGLKPRAERSRTQKQIEDAVRAELAKLPGITVAVGNRPIFISLMGPDPAVLDAEVLKLAAKVRAIPGVTDLETSVTPGVPAFAVTLRPEATRELGLDANQLAANLRAYVLGDVATWWTAPDGKQVEVEVRLTQGSREQIEQLKSLPVAYTKDGTALPLESVATLRQVDNPAIIKRQDLQRRQAVYAGVQGRPQGDVGADVKKVVDATVLPPGYRFDVGGATKNQAEAFGGMLSALVLSVIFIYIVLASQFGSFLMPLAIMASLPLALIGVMLALLLWRSTFNIFSMIGLIMLMGLVTKNAILLVDFANQGVRAGLSVPQALLEAGQVRMRPILMTTAAMVFGMLPLALGLEEGGDMQSSMGRAIIGGVITSTLLTLVVVPVLYSFLSRKTAGHDTGAAPTSAVPVADEGRPA